jgi:hypothetical protein
VLQHARDSFQRQGAPLQPSNDDSENPRNGVEQGDEADERAGETGRVRSLSPRVMPTKAQLDRQ